MLELFVNQWERFHFLHRAWRYRLWSEKFGISFLLSRDLQEGTAVDIGANRGIYSYWMHRKVGANGHVVAFEPQPELNISLDQLKSRFGLSRLTIVPLGLSSTTEEKLLHRPKNHWGGSSFERVSAEDCDVLTVQVTTMDHFFEEHVVRPIRFIKCDVEGHEYDVFLGARHILKVDRPDLLFECHHGHDTNCQVFRYLNSLDYAGYCFFQGGYLPVSKYSQMRARLHRKALYDFVFVPKEREERHLR